MEPPQVTTATFLTGGSWHSYQIEDCELNPDVTPLDIQRYLNAFNEKYIVASNFVSLEDLICFGLHLEERPVERKKKRRKGKPPENVKFEPKIFKLKVAVSIHDSLLFCNRLLNQNLRNIFMEVFEAKNLILYDLSGSPPYELLLLFRQGAPNKQSKDNNLAKTKMALDAELDPFSETEIHYSGRIEIGCAIRRYPAIRRLSANIEHISLKSTNELVKPCNICALRVLALPPLLFASSPLPKVSISHHHVTPTSNWHPAFVSVDDCQDMKVDQVKLELVGPSIFETYLKFVEANYIHDLPDWLTACRDKGRTHANIRYK